MYMCLYVYTSCKGACEDQEKVFVTGDLEL